MIKRLFNQKGPSGLTSIKQCLDDNLEPTCFEASDHTGGLWRYTEVNEKDKDPHSSIYQSVIIITSKEVVIDLICFFCTM